MASLKPKLFCGVALIGEKFPSTRVHAGAVLVTPQYLSNDRYLLVEQRLHTYRTKWTLLLFASDTSARNGRLYGCKHLLSSAHPVNPAKTCQETTFEIRYQTPYPAAAINPTTSSPTHAMINLNFLYRLLSGGASEPCGKYGGGV